MGGRGLRVRCLGGSRAGEVRLTRFLRNDAVGIEEMAHEAAQRTSLRCQGREVLAIQDTTVVRSAGGGGHYLHVTLAVDAQDGAILGLIDGRFLNRQGDSKSRRHSLPIEAKESFRWLQGADHAASVCAGAARITVVADREGDIYETFALLPREVDLVVRAAQDRSLGDGGRLFATLDGLAEAGQAELDLPSKPGRAARRARIAVRFMAAELARPASGSKQDLPAAARMTLIDVREPDPPPGEVAVHWRLLTTYAVANAAEAWGVIEVYRRRWAIEQVFRTLKTQGFDIEGLRIAEAAPRNRLVMAALVAAVIVQQLVHARDGGPGPLRPLGDAFDQEDQRLLEAFCGRLEGKTDRQKNPHPKGSLAYAAWVCARLGGWTGYYGKAGPIVMLEGWLQFHAAKKGLSMLTAAINV
jgi:hypothetical protein